MPPRLKKLIALFVLLPGLGVYVFAAAAIGERLPANELIRAPFYVIAGVAWALPVRYLIIWANREPVDPDRDNPPRSGATPS